MTVAIIGAGAIGGYLGAVLLAAGEHVVLVHPSARSCSADSLCARTRRGITLRCVGQLKRTDDYSEIHSAELCLIAVKSHATVSVARALEHTLASDATVVSFQNGLHNAERLRTCLNGRVSAGVVGFNVHTGSDGCRHQTTSGRLFAQWLPSPHSARLLRLADICGGAGHSLELRSDIERVQAGKLLLNLNNGICAATGLDIATSLYDRDARLCYAECLREGSRVLRDAGLEPARLSLLSADAIERVLRLPNWLLAPLLTRTGAVDARASSSTLEDLKRCRTTEIDELNGEIVARAARLARGAPCNAVVQSVVHEHEAAIAAGNPPQFLSPARLRSRITEMIHGSLAD